MDEIIDWLSNNITKENGNSFRPEDIQNVMGFSILWNIFESVFCDKQANMCKINAAIDKHISEIHFEKVQSIFHYYHGRYQDNDRLDKLKLKNSDKTLVRNVLNNNYKDKNNRIKFIMAIIYRYRNNLFHGEKDIVKITLQEENFKHANRFLMHFIETCRKSDS